MSKRILITGVAQGLGRAMTEQFIALGHRVMGCDRHLAAITDLQQQFGLGHDFAQIDIIDDAQVQVWSDRLLQVGSPDLVINNAGYMHSPAPLWEISAAVFDQTIDVNVKGVANIIRNFVPAMIAKNHGIIINISAQWGRSAAANAAPFCASKWAIEGLTQALAQELPSGMAAVTFSPGAVHTHALEVVHGIEKASRYRQPKDWAIGAVPFLLSISPEMNGQALS